DLDQAIETAQKLLTNIFNQAEGKVTKSLITKLLELIGKSDEPLKKQLTTESRFISFAETGGASYQPSRTLVTHLWDRHLIPHQNEKPSVEVEGLTPALAKKFKALHAIGT
ncbi:MAG: hypothetical protein ACHQJ6_04600, partial [Candidatus Berkiellales bacterium]